MLKLARSPRLTLRGHFVDDESGGHWSDVDEVTLPTVTITGSIPAAAPAPPDPTLLYVGIGVVLFFLLQDED